MRYCYDDVPRTGELKVNLNKNTSENAASIKFVLLLITLKEAETEVKISFVVIIFVIGGISVWEGTTPWLCV